MTKSFRRSESINLLPIPKEPQEPLWIQIMKGTVS